MSAQLSNAQSLQLCKPQICRRSMAFRATQSCAISTANSVTRKEWRLCSPYVKLSSPVRDVRVAAQPGGSLGDEEGMDVAVFRFTLGIPGFEDRLIPRVVGLVAAALLVVNHYLGAQPAPEAQVRAEFLVIALAVISFLVPEVEERLKEALPGRGRVSMAEKIDGATNAFVLKSGLQDLVKQDLAWSSVSLIKNTNSCGVIVVHDGQVVMARGALGSNVVNKDSQATISAVTQDLTSASVTSISSAASPESVSSSAAGPCVYLQDRAAIQRTPAGSWKCVPTGAAALLVQEIPAKGSKPSFMLLFSERARALSDKERKWAAAIASKLGASLS